MKKFMKSCAITALVLIVLGIALIGIAAAVKGPEVASKAVEALTDGKIIEKLGNLENLGIDIGNGVADMLGDLDADIQYDLEKDLKFAEGIEILKGDVEKDFAADGIEELDIEVAGGKMLVAVSEDEDFHLKTKDVKGMQGYVKDGKLRIMGIGSSVTGAEAKENMVTLYIPDTSSLEEIEIQLGAGSLKIETALKGDKISISAGAGEISCKEPVQADELEIEVGAGTLAMDDMNVGSLKTEVGIGAVKISGEIGEKAKLKCGMGSIEMTLAGSEKDYDYQMEAAAGSIKAGSYSTDSAKAKKEIRNNADKEIVAECAMGSIGISFTE